MVRGQEYHSLTLMYDYKIMSYLVPKSKNINRRKATERQPESMVYKITTCFIGWLLSLSEAVYIAHNCSAQRKSYTKQIYRFMYSFAPRGLVVTSAPFFSLLCRYLCSAPFHSLPLLSVTHSLGLLQGTPKTSLPTLFQRRLISPLLQGNCWW